MKTPIKALALLFTLCVLMAFSGCASNPKPKETGFLDGYYKDLQPGPPGGVKWRWVDPAADFSKYNKLMIDSVVFYLSDASEDKGIDTEDMQELTKAFDQAVVNALADKYTLVAEPGPGVVRIRVAITELKKSKPVISAITSVVPVGLGISLVRKGSTGSWSGAGKTGMEMMALDSVTTKVLAVAEDERSAEFTERFSGLGSAKEAFKFWAERLRAFVDRIHGMKQ